MPRTDTKIKILKAEPLKFWNKTAEDKFCWMKYAGPKYILVNTTSNCQLDVQDFWITEYQNTLSGHPCKEEKLLDKIEDPYHPDICVRHINPNTYEDYIQVKRINGFYKIYCYGMNISINDYSQICPEFVFEIAINEKFELNGVQYDLGEVTTVTVNTMELTINEEISDRLKLDEIKIYGINTTSLDSSFAKLFQISKNIMSNVTTIESPLPESLTKPIKYIGNSISNFLTKFGIAISAILGIASLIILLPIIEIGLILGKVCYRIIVCILDTIQRFLTPLKRIGMRRRRRSRLRRYITEP